MNRSNKVDPIVIARSQYDSVQSYRTDLEAQLKAQLEGRPQSAEQADKLRVARATILQDLFKHGIPDWLPEFDHQGKNKDSPTTMDPTAQLPTNTTSVPPVPVAGHVQHPSLSEPSLFDPERADECAGALKNGFTQIHPEGEFNFSDEILDGTVQPSAMSVPVPVDNHSERPSLYVSSLFSPENVDEWNPFSGFWQN
jgi:hypothetical protein